MSLDSNGGAGEMRRNRKRPRGHQRTQQNDWHAYAKVERDGVAHQHAWGDSGISASHFTENDEAPPPPLPSSLRTGRRLQHKHRQRYDGLPSISTSSTAVRGHRSSDYITKERGERNADASSNNAAYDDNNTYLTSDASPEPQQSSQADLIDEAEAAGTSGTDTETSQQDSVPVTTSTSNAEAFLPEALADFVLDAEEPTASSPSFAPTETLLTFEIETTTNDFPNQQQQQEEVETTTSTTADDTGPSFIDSAPENNNSSTSTLLEAAVEDEYEIVENDVYEDHSHPSDLLPNGCDATPMTCEDGSLNYKRGIPPDCVYPPCDAPGVHDTETDGPLQQPPQPEGGAEPTTGSDNNPLGCSRITQLCDDGLTYVGLDPETDCKEYKPCPTSSPSSPPSTAPTTSSPTHPPSVSPSRSPTANPSSLPSRYEGDESGNDSNQDVPEFVSSQPNDDDEDDNITNGPDKERPAPSEPTTANDRHTKNWKDMNINAVNDPKTTLQLAPVKPEEISSSPPSETLSSTPSQQPTTRPTTSQPSYVPTATTAHPSASPSMATSEPSQAQTSLNPSTSPPPSAAPSYENTISWEPTAEPTFEPSRSKAELVGFRPPTAGPRTESPTFTLAPTISLQPTMTMSPTFTPPPTTFLDCLNTNSAYAYGTAKVWGDDMIVVPVMYHYELELAKEPAPGILQNEIVPAIELAVNEALLPSLFECQEKDEVPLDDPDGTSTLAKVIEGSPIVGITANPDDIVKADEACASPALTGDVCHSVRGELTLSLEGDEDADAQQEAKKAALRLIRFAMDRDDLINAHPSIERVIFVPMDQLEFVAPPPTPAPIAARDESPTERIRGFPAIITIAILLLLVGIYMVYRGLKSKNESDENYAKERGLEEHMQTEIEDDAMLGGGLTLEDGFAEVESPQGLGLVVDNNEALDYADADNSGFGDQDSYSHFSEKIEGHPAPALPPSTRLSADGSQSRASRRMSLQSLEWQVANEIQGNSSPSSRRASSLPSQPDRSTGTPSMEWQLANEVQGNFSPADGAFEQSVSSGWGTPQGSEQKMNSDVRHEQETQPVDDDDLHGYN